RNNAVGELGQLQRAQHAPFPAHLANTVEEEIEEEREEEERRFFEVPLQKHNEGDEDAPPEQLVGMNIVFTGLVISCILCITAVTIIFGSQTLPVYATVIAVVVAMLLSVLGVGWEAEGPGDCFLRDEFCSGF